MPLILSCIIDISVRGQRLSSSLLITQVQQLTYLHLHMTYITLTISYQFLKITFRTMRDQFGNSRPNGGVHSLAH